MQDYSRSAHRDRRLSVQLLHRAAPPKLPPRGLQLRARGERGPSSWCLRHCLHTSRGTRLQKTLLTASTSRLCGSVNVLLLPSLHDTAREARQDKSVRNNKNTNNNPSFKSGAAAANPAPAGRKAPAEMAGAGGSGTARARPETPGVAREPACARRGRARELVSFRASRLLAGFAGAGCPGLLSKRFLRQKCPFSSPAVLQAGARGRSRSRPRPLPQTRDTQGRNGCRSDSCDSGSAGLT